jgi:hypothetical protein
VAVPPRFGPALAISGRCQLPHGALQAAPGDQITGGVGVDVAGPRVETVSSDGKQVHVLARERPATLIWGNPVWTADGKRILVAIEAH